MALVNLFRSSPIGKMLEAMDLQFMDLGARGGMDRDFLPAAWASTATGFEPEPEECGKLNARSAAPWRAARYVPTALSGADGPAVLHIPANCDGASLLRHNPAMVPAFGYDALHGATREVAVAALTLDSACIRFQLATPDYIKIDVEGAELDILRAALHPLAHCSALKVEVSFMEQRLAQPLLHDVLAFMLGQGFVLAEILGVHYWRRRPLPAHPFSARWVVPYSKGVAAQCDLVFLRDFSALPEGDASVRLVAVAAILGYFDHAVGALRQANRLEARLNQTIRGDFVRELGIVSHRMGRAVAIGEAKARLRSMIPLLRSVLWGLPHSGPATTGY